MKIHHELNTRSDDGYLVLCLNNDQIHGMILRPDCRVQLSTCNDGNSAGSVLENKDFSERVSVLANVFDIFWS